MLRSGNQDCPLVEHELKYLGDQKASFIIEVIQSFKKALERNSFEGYMISYQEGIPLNKKANVTGHNRARR